jgi:hypothetical protein
MQEGDGLKWSGWSEMKWKEQMRGNAGRGWTKMEWMERNEMEGADGGEMQGGDGPKWSGWSKKKLVEATAGEGA